MIQYRNNDATVRVSNKQLHIPEMFLAKLLKITVRHFLRDFLVKKDVCVPHHNEQSYCRKSYSELLNLLLTGA